VAHQPYLRAVLRRVVLSVPLVLIVSAISFALLSLAPGSAATSKLPPTATRAQVEALRYSLGLDQPIYGQYWRWLSHALHGDLGVSYVTTEPVTRLITERLPVSLALICGALFVFLVIGIPLGIATAVRQTAANRALDIAALVGFAIPTFWTGAMLIEGFAVGVRWFPVVGYVPLVQSPAQWLRSLVLPVLALSIGGMAVVAKTTREAMLDVLGSEHIRMAWANGVSARSVFMVYALKNAAFRIVTIFGLMTIGLLGGTVVVETVFALPGLGGALVNGVNQRDLPTTQGIVVLFTLIIVAVNLFIDMVYVGLDPRVRQR
jgi:peptide/nickel transport system permease protein